MRHTLRCGRWAPLGLLGAAALLTAQPVQAQNQAQSARVAAVEHRIDSIFAALDRTRRPGCVLGIHQDGALTFARGYGMADLDQGVPLSSGSVFRIGSVSKQITAAVVVLLELDGLLSLDDPLAKHLPEFERLGSELTLRHMLHHTSGLRDYLVLMSLKGMRDDDYYSDDDLVALLARQTELNFEPGTDFLYSNSGYFLLSQVVKRVMGTSLREEAQVRIFGPLGMRKTHFHDDHREIVPQRASGYERDDDATTGWVRSMTTLPMTGDGGVFTTVEDWARWNANWSNPIVGGQAMVDRLLTPGVLSSGDSIPYALAQVHGSHHGLYTIGHSGSFVGYQADHVRYPDQGVAVTAFCNFAEARPSEWTMAVAEVLLGDQMRPSGAQPTSVRPSSSPAETPTQPTPLTPQELADIAGDFRSEELDVIYRISADDDGRLVLRVSSRSIPLLKHPEGFSGEGVTLRPLVPGNDRNGPIQAFLVDAGRVRNLRFVRIPGS